LAQGKAWDKEKIINEVLKPLFEMGYSVTKACKHAGITQSTVDTWIQNDDELRLKVSYWQGDVDRIARKNVINTIKSPEKKESLGVSIDWLEKREKDEFSTRTEQDITSKGEKLEGIKVEIIDSNDSKHTGN
jgi:predicted transcriptional regulator